MPLCVGEQVLVPKKDGTILSTMKNFNKELHEMIPKVAEGGYTNLICFSGNRRGMDDISRFDKLRKGLKEIIPLAEKHGVVIQMELLNSKVNHKDYMCDHTDWGVALCETIGSESFKLLYDIYHMQIMEGDIIRNIKEYHQYIGHYHTGGNPGRNEIDETQELYYPAIMKAILKLVIQAMLHRSSSLLGQIK